MCILNVLRLHYSVSRNKHMVTLLTVHVTLFISILPLCTQDLIPIPCYTLPPILYHSSSRTAQSCRPFKVLSTFTILLVKYILAFLFLSSLISHFTGVQKLKYPGFPGGAAVESLPANAGDTGSSPGLGRSHMPRSD